MTADEFIEWYAGQPAHSRYELLDGHVHEQRPDPPRIAAIKARITASLRRQIVEKVLPCLPIVETVAVKIDDTTVFEPDAFVRFVREGVETTAETPMIEDPMIVVEIVSAATRPIAVAAKLDRYFDNPHIRHILVIEPAAHAVVHHTRTHDGGIAAARYDSGAIDMPLARVTVAVAELFED